MNKHTLKLITLNIWGGHVEQPLLSFINSHNEVDIFCFQEVYCNAKAIITNETRYVNLDIFSEIARLLPNHKGYFRPVVNGIYGIAIFVKNSIEVINESEIVIYYNTNYCGVGPTHTRILQFAQLKFHNQIFTIANIHGLWNGMGKTDSPDRLEQSFKIKSFINKIQEPLILCGDFNLLPLTESLKIISNGLNDHIKINNVQSTRTSYYPKPEKFADYIFSTPNVKVTHFQVLIDEVSDHAPLLLKFQIDFNWCTF